MSDVSTSFEEVSDEISIEQLVPVIRKCKCKYLVIRCSNDTYAVWPLRGQHSLVRKINQAAVRLGRALLRLRISDVPGLCNPCLPVDRDDPWTWADRRKRKSKSPRQCTVVVEDDHLIGVLGTVFRGNYLTYLPGRRFPMFQVEDADSLEEESRRCPECGQSFTHYVVVVASGSPEYACPHCHEILEG
jgi:ribosomal protein S27AE